MMPSSPRRAGPPRRARSLLVRVARARWPERLARGIVSAILIGGLVTTAWGMLGTVTRVNTGMTALAEYAGGGENILSSTAVLIQFQVLSLLGLVAPQSAEAVSSTGEDPTVEPAVGQPGPATPTPFQPAADGAGLLPYRIEVGGQAEQAPVLPVTGEAAATQPPPASPPEPPAPTDTPEPPGPPGWIVIPSIGLDAPVILSTAQLVSVDNKTFEQFQAPNLYAAGWQEGSAMLGEPGNTVLNGHHNIDGMVFGHLYELQRGDQIIVYSGSRPFYYAVAQVMKLEERGMPLEQRQENARWVLPSSDERLTLVTCWPPTTNTYRLIVVAVPTGP